MAEIIPVKKYQLVEEDSGILPALTTKKGDPDFRLNCSRRTIVKMLKMADKVEHSMIRGMMVVATFIQDQGIRGINKGGGRDSIEPTHVFTVQPIFMRGKNKLYTSDIMNIDIPTCGFDKSSFDIIIDETERQSSYLFFALHFNCIRPLDANFGYLGYAENITNMYTIRISNLVPSGFLINPIWSSDRAYRERTEDAKRLDSKLHTIECGESAAAYNRYKLEHGAR